MQFEKGTVKFNKQELLIIGVYFMFNNSKNHVLIKQGIEYLQECMKKGDIEDIVNTSNLLNNIVGHSRFCVENFYEVLTHFLESHGGSVEEFMAEIKAMSDNDCGGDCDEC